MAEHKAVYLAAVGGAAALIARSIVAAEPVAYEDLGTEMIRRLTVEDFPAVVVNDTRGNDLYSQSDVSQTPVGEVSVVSAGAIEPRSQAEKKHRSPQEQVARSRSRPEPLPTVEARVDQEQNEGEPHDGGGLGPPALEKAGQCPRQEQEQGR